MKNTIEQLFAVTAPGLEAVCAAELHDLGLGDAAPVAGGVVFSGGLREIYLANLWLRSASRILVRLSSFKSRDFPDLYRKTLRLPWGRFIRPETGIAVRVGSHGSRLNHTDRIAATISEAIDHSLGRPTPHAGESGQLVLARFTDDLCQLSVDSSGDLLHRRGYREETAQAPLRETLAAGMLRLLGWDGSTALVDPMCGSGTFVIEAALLAARRAPGLPRHFAFMDWPGYRAGLWDVLCAEARRQEQAISVSLYGGELNNEALAAAQRNALRAGVTEQVRWVRRELSEWTAPAARGLVICNPPYGKRLAPDADLRPLFQSLGATYRRFTGWRGAFVCPDDRLAAATGLPLRPAALLTNGGIPITLWVADL